MRRKLTQYQMDQILLNTRMRDAAMNNEPYINVGRYGITFPKIMEILAKVITKNNPFEIPMQSATKTLFIADNIRCDVFSKYMIGEIQILVADIQMEAGFEELAYEVLQVDNKISIVIFKQNLTATITKERAVANLYSICKALVALYKLDGLDSFWGSIYMNTIIVAPLELTCKIWHSISGTKLKITDFDKDLYPEGELFFLTEEVIELINGYDPEYVLNFGILNDQL